MIQVDPKKQEELLVIRNIQKERNILGKRVQEGPSKAENQRFPGDLPRPPALGPAHTGQAPAHVGHQLR